MLSNKKVIEEWKRVILSEPVEHDEKACKAWYEYQSLYKARHSDMVAVADKYRTTPQEMKEHKRCHRHRS